jgi:deoxyuridine 5'-triphosphate nucleotidohydrolase
MVRVVLQGRDQLLPMSVLLDTGNRIRDGVAISQRLARRLGLKVHPCQVRVSTAAQGGSMDAAGRVRDLKMWLSPKQCMTIKQALVLPTLNHDMNIGSEFLQRERGTIDYNHQTPSFVMKGERVPLISTIGGENPPEDEERCGVPPGDHSTPNPKISAFFEPFQRLNRLVAEHFTKSDDVNNEHNVNSFVNVQTLIMNDMSSNNDLIFSRRTVDSAQAHMANLNAIAMKKKIVKFKLRNAPAVRKGGVRKAPLSEGIGLKIVQVKNPPISLSVIHNRIVAPESVGVTHFRALGLGPKQSIVIGSNCLNSMTQAYTCEGVYRVEHGGIVRVPVINLGQDPVMIKGGDTVSGEVCSDSVTKIGRDELELRPVPSLNKLGETQEAEVGCEEEELTKAEEEDPSFQEVWADLGMEENELLREHPKVKKQVKRLIFEFKDIFSRAAPGKTDLVKMKLRLKPGTEPVRQRYRDLNPKMLKDLEKQMDEWIQQDVIEPSTSPWASPLVPVRKKDGSTRWAVDFRRLNACLEQDSYPLPRIQTLLERAGGHRVYSALDATQAYFNIEIEPESRSLTAFATPHGLWQFRRMPFGISTAPAVYSRFIAAAMNPLGSEICQSYLDDVISYNKEVAAHVPQMREVFTAHRTAGIKLKAKKTQLFQRRIQYLGHLLSEEGIGMVPEYTQRIRGWPSPKTVAELNSMLGFLGYYRLFIPEYAERTADMNSQKKAVKLNWTPNMEREFEQLKAEFERAPIRAVPDFESDEPFHLTTDYSGKAVSAILSQVQGGKERLIAAMGRKTTDAEKRYPSWKGEAAAVVYGIRKFHPILSYRQFIINTDNSALLQLKSLKKNTGMLSRWTEELAGYDFRVNHRPGKKNTNADALSRRDDDDMPEPSREEEEEQQEYIGAVEAEEPDDAEPIRVTSTLTRARIIEAQEEDPILQQVREWVRKKRPPDKLELRGRHRDLQMYAGIFETLQLASDNMLEQKIVTFAGDRTRIVVPEVLKEAVFKQVHEGVAGAHFGVHSTLSRLMRNYIFIGVQTDTRLRVSVCHNCVQKRVEANIKAGGQVPIRNGYPLQTVYLDVCGEFNRTAEGYKYILSIQDGFSRYVQAYPLKSKTATEVAKTLADRYVSTFGCPQSIHSDQGTEFCNKVVKDLMRQLGINHELGPVANPQSNLVERWHRTMKEALRAITHQDGQCWINYLPGLILAYNTRVHSSTGVTPFLAFMGREATIPADLVLRLPDAGQVQNVSDATRTILDRYTKMYEEVARNEETVIKRNSRQYANKREFVVGDLVYYLAGHKKNLKEGETQALVKQWKGPYMIIEKIAKVLYKLKGPRDLDTEVITAHVGRLRRFYGSLPGSLVGKPPVRWEPDDDDEEGEVIPLNVNRGAHAGMAQPPAFDGNIPPAPPAPPAAPPPPGDGGNPGSRQPLQPEQREEEGDIPPLEEMPAAPPDSSPPRREEREPAPSTSRRGRSPMKRAETPPRNIASPDLVRDRSPRTRSQSQPPRIRYPSPSKRPLSSPELDDGESEEKGESGSPKKQKGGKHFSGKMYTQMRDMSKGLSSSDEELDMLGCLSVSIKKGARTPHRASEGAAGYDLYAPAAVSLPPHQVTIVPLNIAVQIPPGYFLKLWGRSSLERKGVVTLGGVIDSDYRGPISLILLNTSENLVKLNKNERVCQAVFLKYEQVVFRHVFDLDPSDRDQGGFGSTGSGIHDRSN